MYTILKQVRKAYSGRVLNSWFLSFFKLNQQTRNYMCLLATMDRYGRTQREYKMSKLMIKKLINI